MRALAGLAAVITLAACGGGGAARTFDRWGRPSGPVHHIEYEARLSRDLERFEVTACFEDEPPRWLRPGRMAARPMLVDVYVLRDGDENDRAELATDDVGIVLTGVEEDDCVRYRVELADVGRGFGPPLVARVGDAIFTTLGAWLWGPADERPVEASLRLVLPDGFHAVVPFTRRDGDTYTVPDSAFRFVGFAAFGRMGRERVPVRGGALDVAWLDGGEPMRATRGELRGWLERAAGATSTLLGRFPVRHAAVLVIAMPGRGRGHGFGMVGRGGGASVMLIVDADAPVERLDASWVTVHEMSHLAAPYVTRADAWLGEGIATYYQEVLRARGRLQSQEDAWEALLDGFRRGAGSGSGRTLAGESADVRSTFEFVRIYWAGAAIAFLADVELRRASGGRLSLDVALDRLRACCSTPREWTARELAVEIDRVTRTRIFSTLVARWTRSTEFPDVSDALRAVGVSTTDGRVTLDATDGRALRDAITAPR